MTSPTPPSSPVDPAAVEAIKKLIEQQIQIGDIHDGARIITDCYAEQTKRLSRTVKTICDARRFIEAETVHHANISLNDWIQGKLDRITTERVVREKLVEACKSLVAADKAHNIDIAVEDATNLARAALAEAEKLEDSE